MRLCDKCIHCSGIVLNNLVISLHDEYHHIVYGRQCSSLWCTVLHSFSWMLAYTTIYFTFTAPLLLSSTCKLNHTEVPTSRSKIQTSSEGKCKVWAVRYLFKTSVLTRLTCKWNAKGFSLTLQRPISKKHGHLIGKDGPTEMKGKCSSKRVCQQ